jgi:hypothetical protein
LAKAAAHWENALRKLAQAACTLLRGFAAQMALARAVHKVYGWHRFNFTQKRLSA